MAHLRELMRALGVSQARMERGNMRCDANISMPKGSSELGTRTETKNINSLRSVEAALRHEIRRQGAVLAGGGRVVQETRMWHEEGYTTAGRSKETAEDYRYSNPIWCRWRRAVNGGAAAHDTARATVRNARSDCRPTGSTTDLEMRDVNGNEGAIDLIEQTVSAGASPATARKWWLTGNWPAAPTKPVSGSTRWYGSWSQVADLQRLVDDGTLTDKLARQVIDGVLAGEGSPRTW